MQTATEPKFLEARRQAALALTSTLKLPGAPKEDWRRTSLAGFDMKNFTLATPKMEFTGDVPAGVIFTDILTAATQHPELVQQHLGSLVRMDEDLLTASQAAHLNAGVFVYVPKNVELAEPLQVSYTCEEGQAYYIHTLVVAEDNASVTLLEKYEGTGEYLHVGLVEAVPGTGSKVRYGYLQNHGEDAWTFSTRRASTGRDSIMEWVGGEFGGGLTRSELVTNVTGQGSNSTIKVVYGATGNQHMNIYTSECHTGADSRSDILGRGVLSGKAHTVFWGNGEIQANAINSATYQKQEALVLSEKARADAIPALIIDEFEVAGAGHAATVGKLDEDQLFYLMARGLSRKQAIHMLVLAFLSPVLDQIPVEGLREEMTRLMGEKVNG